MRMAIPLIAMHSGSCPGIKLLFNRSKAGQTLANWPAPSNACTAHLKWMIGQDDPVRKRRFCGSPCEPNHFCIEVVLIEDPKIWYAIRPMLACLLYAPSDETGSCNLRVAAGCLKIFRLDLCWFIWYLSSRHLGMCYLHYTSNLLKS